MRNISFGSQNIHGSQLVNVSIKPCSLYGCYSATLGASKCASSCLMVFFPSLFEMAISAVHANVFYPSSLPFVKLKIASFVCCTFIVLIQQHIDKHPIENICSYSNKSECHCIQYGMRFFTFAVITGNEIRCTKSEKHLSAWFWIEKKTKQNYIASRLW